MEPSIKVGSRLGKLLKEARKAKGLTQDQLAARLQVNDCDMARYTYARIETGKRHVTVAEINALMEILDLQYEDFFKQD